MDPELESAPRRLPKWTRIVSWFLGLLAAFVGLSLYVTPATFIPDVDFGVPAYHSLVLMWAARQMAIAMAIVAALLLRRSGMLWIALLTYSLMTFQDAVVGLVTKDVGLAAGSAFFFAVSALLLWKTRRFVDSLPSQNL